MFEKKELFDNEEVLKIRIKEYSWEELIKTKDILYEKLCDLILNKDNLFYYATQKNTTKTLENTKKYIKKLINNGTIDVALKDIFNKIGWDENIDIQSTVFQGDLAEYLMSIFIDKLTSLDTIISKISIKTSSKMPVFGNDNILYDFENETLYFGEAKFYSDLIQGIKKAETSIKEHNTITEIGFVRTNTSLMIGENGEKLEKIEEVFENAYIEDIRIKNVIFIANDDIYEKKDYEKKMLKLYGTLEEINNRTEEIIFIFLPILSKQEFLEYFKRRIINE